MANYLLESRLQGLESTLGALAQTVEDNLRTLMLNLTGEESLAQSTLAPLDGLQRDLQKHCLTLISREHPYARDLRYVMACIRIERDYARMEELIDAMFSRIEALRTTVLSDVLQKMTGSMLDIVRLHEAVRARLRRDAMDKPLNEIKTMARHVADDLAVNQGMILRSVLDGRGTPEMTVDLVLACRHLKRIAALIEDLPVEMQTPLEA